MKQEIKKYFESLNPKQLGLKGKLAVKSISVLGSGSSNLNYLVNLSNSKFVFRFNLKPYDKMKSRREFLALKAVEKFNIAPRALILDDSRKFFESDFTILSYLEGKVVDHRKAITDDLIVRIAEIVAKIHSVKIDSSFESLERWGLTPLDELKNYSREYLKPLRKRIENTELLKILETSYKNLRPKAKKDYISHPVLSHGDVCVQNVIENRGKFFLIDFENLEITDASSAIAHIFVDFKIPFDNRQKELFLKAYFSKNSHLDVCDNIELFLPLKFYGVLLWSIKHYLDFKDGKMHQKYSEKNTLESHLNYALFCFKQAIKFEAIDKSYNGFNLKNALKSL